MRIEVASTWRKTCHHPHQTNEEDLSSEYMDNDEELSDGDTDDYFSAASTPISHDTPINTMMDRETGARRLIARLRQPFGVLLLTETPSGGRVPDYMRVAGDRLVTVRFQDGISLADTLDNIRTLEILQHSFIQQ